MNTLAVIIVNWNGREVLQTCLQALEHQTFSLFEIFVLDNGSTDGSQRMLAENFPSVKVTCLPENTGFAYPNNMGMKQAFENPSIEYVVALNNDTIVDPEYLQELVLCARRHGSAGSIQPKVLRLGEKNIIDSTGVLTFIDASAINRGQGEEDRGQYSTEEEIFGVSGSAALYTRKALEDVALSNGDYFDSSYFAYYEDVDLAWRLRLQGYRSYYTPKAIAHHIHSATGKRHSPFKSFHIHRNQYYNIVKDLPGWFAVRALLFMPIRYVLLASSVLRRHGPSAKLAESAGAGIIAIVLRSFRDVVRSLPMLLRKRKEIQRTRKVTRQEVGRWLSLYRASLRKMIYEET